MRDAEFATDHEADALPQAACERRLSEFYRPSMGKVLVHTEKRGPAFEVANQTMRLVRALDRHVFTCSDQDEAEARAERAYRELDRGEL